MNNPDHAGLYLHVPFCLTKCAYCDFYSVTDLSLLQEWLSAVEREIGRYKDCWESFDTLYLGGGTPSLLEEADLIKIFGLLRQNFKFISDTEITLEANPDDLSRDKLDLLKDLGVTRISLGVQSFCDKELHFLGRRHTARQAESALFLIRDCGFKNVSVDLIYGLPGQRLSKWKKTIIHALDFKPEHLSCYQMTIHEGTPLGGLMAQGRIHLLGEEEERRFFITTAEFLEEKGYLHYEISNFAANESTFSRHNSKYWQRQPYLGLGPGAHSFNGRKRWWNIKSVPGYSQKLIKGQLPIEAQETLSEEQKNLESLFLGLRTIAGVDLSLIDLSERTEHIIEELRASNLIRIENNRLIPTLKGFVVADSLPLLFIKA